MLRFEITLKDSSVELVDGATDYAQEGQMTTFYRADSDRGTVLDSWSTRVASIRTGEIMMVRRCEDQAQDRRLATGAAGLRSA